MAAKCADKNGKIAIVTGGAKGIGRGCVEILAENGWTVSFWDIDEKEGTIVQEAYPDRAFFLRCDVTKEDEIKGCLESVITKFGKLDCLVNNVGNQPTEKVIDEYSVDDFRMMLELNMVSPFAMCKYALPYLRLVKGNIVNMSSITVSCGALKNSIYAPSKAGISTLTRCLAIDEAVHDVRVNAIAPGCIRTPMVETVAAGKRGVDVELSHFSQFNLLRRLGEAREIGKACLYLANDATYCTGSVLFATGGIDVGFGHKYC